MRCAALGVVLCSSVLWAASGTKSPETLVITNVNVVDMRHGGIEPKVNVVIEDGVITAISRYSLVDVGPHDRLVNAEGRYLIPGLWDMHARISSRTNWNKHAGFTSYLLNGVTGLRDPEGFEEKCADKKLESLSPEITKRGHSPHPELGIVEFEAIRGLEQADFDSSPGAWIHHEMQELVSTGSSPFQALQAVTYNAALYMGRLDQYGVIERGRIADMVLLDENPLDNIRNTEKIAAVVLRGTYFSRTELEAAKQQANTEQSSRLTQ